jgi:hypothetical protein
LAFFKLVGTFKVASRVSMLYCEKATLCKMMGNEQQSPYPPFDFNFFDDSFLASLYRVACHSMSPPPDLRHPNTAADNRPFWVEQI